MYLIHNITEKMDHRVTILQNSIIDIAISYKIEKTFNLAISKIFEDRINENAVN